VGLEQAPLSLTSRTEELLGRNSSGSGLEIREYGRRDLLRRPRDTLYPQKLALTSTTSGGRLVGIVRLRTKATEFCKLLMQHIFKFCRVNHLVVNLLVQVLLGLPLELVHRWWRVLIVYMAGVVAGSLGTSVCSPYTLLAGASGGVYALLLAHIATIILVRTFDHYTFCTN
jgi:hypothetical protein